MTLTKGNIEFNFDTALGAIELGEAATQDHSNMDLVDFVVDYKNRYLFVAVLDHDTQTIRKKDLKSERLCENLARKYRDSVFFHIFGERESKEVEYAVLFTPKGIDPVLVVVLQDELKRRMPFSHPAWLRDSAVACTIMDMNQWKKRYGDDSVRYVNEEAE